MNQPTCSQCSKPATIKEGGQVYCARHYINQFIRPINVSQQPRLKSVRTEAA